MTLYDHIRIALGTCCLALAVHPLLAGKTDTRENIDCQIISLGSTEDTANSPTFKCGGAEVAMSDTVALMGLAQNVRQRFTARFKTRWLRCRLTEITRPIAFGLMSDYVARGISACKPLMVTPSPRRWICFMAPRGACHT